MSFVLPFVATHLSIDICFYFNSIVLSLVLTQSTLNFHQWNQTNFSFLASCLSCISCACACVLDISTLLYLLYSNLEKESPQQTSITHILLEIGGCTSCVFNFCKKIANLKMKFSTKCAVRDFTRIFKKTPGEFLIIFQSNKFDLSALYMSYQDDYS